jgi:DNA repair protein RadD
LNLTLRDYQIECVQDIRQAYRSGYRAPLLVAPVGSGKSVIYAYITEQAAKKGNRILILEHRIELVYQTSEKLDMFGVQHGIIAPNHTMTYDYVQIASVQTMARRLNKIKQEYNLIIIDECHHSVAAQWRKILDHFSTSLLLGVTATPLRLDGKGLGISAGGYFDTLVLGPSPRELQAQGFISRVKVYSPPIGINLSSIHRKYGEYVKSELEEEMDRPKIIGNAVAHYLKICPGVPAIAFSPSVEMAKNVAQEFRDAGVMAESLDGTDDAKTRKYRIAALGDGRIKILSTADIVSEGTDIPIVGAAILLRPTLSFGLCRQQIGRVMRPYPGKEYATVLDHVGNVGSVVDGEFRVKHGFPDDDYDWSLDGETGEKRRKAEQTVVANIQCERCYLVFPAWLAQCPSCGWVRESGRKVEEIEGELEEIQRVEQEMRERFARKREISMAKTLEDLEALGKRLGYKSGWAYYVWQSRIERGVAAG